MGLLFFLLKEFILHDLYVNLIKIVRRVERLLFGIGRINIGWTFSSLMIRFSTIFFLIIFRSNFLLVVIYQHMSLMVKKVFYSFIIRMDEVQVMLLLCLKLNMMQHKHYLNIKKLWVHDILNYFVVQQLKYNRLVFCSISSRFINRVIEYFYRYFVEVKIRKIFKHH